MSAAQTSIISIIMDISKKHQSYLTLQTDKMYRTWLKHVRRKRELQATLKKDYADQDRQRKLEFEAQPKYF